MKELDIEIERNTNKILQSVVEVMMILNERVEEINKKEISCDLKMNETVELLNLVLNSFIEMLNKSTEKVNLINYKGE